MLIIACWKSRKGSNFCSYVAFCPKKLMKWSLTCQVVKSNKDTDATKGKNSAEGSRYCGIGRVKCMQSYLRKRRSVSLV